MKRNVYVKPVVPYEDEKDSKGWLVIKLNVIESFFDDWKRYGLGVAIHNLFHS